VPIAHHARVREDRMPSGYYTSSQLCGPDVLGHLPGSGPLEIGCRPACTPRLRGTGVKRISRIQAPASQGAT